MGSDLKLDGSSDGEAAARLTPGVAPEAGRVEGQRLGRAEAHGRLWSALVLCRRRRLPWSSDQRLGTAGTQARSTPGPGPSHVSTLRNAAQRSAGRSFLLPCRIGRGVGAAHQVQLRGFDAQFPRTTADEARPSQPPAGLRASLRWTPEAAGAGSVHVQAQRSGDGQKGTRVAGRMRLAQYKKYGMESAHAAGASALLGWLRSGGAGRCADRCLLCFGHECFQTSCPDSANLSCVSAPRRCVAGSLAAVLRTPKRSAVSALCDGLATATRLGV